MSSEQAEPVTRVAVVTGGATGIGRAVCRALAAKGMRVGVVYNSSEDRARALAEELDDAFVLRADLGDPAQIDALVKQLKEVAGRVDVLVNNAGYNRNAPIFKMKLDDYDAVTGVGRGTWYLTKLVLRQFMLRTGGRIVNISSVVGHTGNAGPDPLHHGQGRPRRHDPLAGPGADGAATSWSTRWRRASSRPT